MTAIEFIKEHLKEYETEGLWLFKTDELIKLLSDYSTIQCKEQRENCSQSITFVGLQSSINVDYYTVNREQIKNAKQPSV